MVHRLDTYRTDIDGIRALAVLAVLLFHFQFEDFVGGYVGVDVFFVISGFLITGQILKELRTDTFSFVEFYKRRVRRLFPALFCMLLATLVAGTFLLAPEPLEALGESSLFAVFSLSNFLFYSQSGYFDSDSIQKPLLHTWSLGVEEQFYLFWPLFLFLIFIPVKKGNAGDRFVFLVLLIIAGISLAISQHLLKTDPPASFYLPHSRIFQFCGGGLLAIYQPQIRYPLAKELLLLMGLAMVVYPIITFTHQTSFPGVHALWPTAGTMLMIAAGNPRFSGLLLTNRLCTFTGKISYSLYLYHWPLVVFYIYCFGQNLSTMEKVALLAISYLLGAASYFFIETPFRRSAQPATGIAGQNFPTYALAATLPVLFISANMWGNAGWPWRFQQLPAEDIEELFNLDELRVETLTYFNQHVLGPYFSLEGKRTKVLVIGDSHGRDASNGLKQALPESSHDVKMQAFDDDCIYILTNEADRIPASNQSNCSSQANSLRMSLKVEQADIVVISAAWSTETAQRSLALIETIRSTSKRSVQRVVVFGRTPDFFNFQAEAINLLQRGKSKLEINHLARKRAQINDQIDALLEKTARDGNIEFWSKTPVVCSHDSCDFFTPEGSLAIWDHNHWTLKGAKLFGARMAKLLELDKPIATN